MRSVFLFALWVVTTIPLAAQRYDDSITVSVVDVPVYVERFGKPITGLTREDFELFVNGRPHPIEYFDVLEESREAETRTDAAVDLKRRRLIVLLFDAAAPPHVLRRARMAAATFVGEGAPGDTFAVATVSWAGVLFIVPFTNDRAAVQRAITTLRPSEAQDPFRVATLERERTAGDVGVIGDILGGRHSGFEPPGGFEMPAIADRFVDAPIDAGLRDNFTSRGLIGNLNDLADRLAALDGLKEVLLFSEANGDPDAAFTWAGQLAATVRLHQRYRAAGIILNAVDLSPQRAPGGAAAVATAPLSEGMPNIMTSEFLWSLALDTGGIATSSLRELQKRQSVGYLIGFRPPPSQSKSNGITIRVKDQPLLTDVRYRKSYTLDREPTDDGLFLADTLLNDIPQNGVTLDVRVDGMWVSASIPGVELLSYAANGSRLHLDVYFYAFHDQRPVAWNHLRVTVDLEKGREFLSVNPYAMRQQFHLEPGRYIAKALVRIEGTDRVGFKRAELLVPPS